MRYSAINPLHCRDTCLALTLLVLLFQLFWGGTLFLYTALGLVLLGMIFPGAMKPLAWGWYGLAEVLGMVVSKILLLGIFALLVLPVAVFRRMMGKDSLHLKAWHKQHSSFISRVYTFTAEDLKKSY